MMVKSSGSVFCEELGWRWSGDCEGRAFGAIRG